MIKHAFILLFALTCLGCTPTEDSNPAASTGDSSNASAETPSDNNKTFASREEIFAGGTCASTEAILRCASAKFAANGQESQANFLNDYADATAKTDADNPPSKDKICSDIPSSSAFKIGISGQRWDAEEFDTAFGECKK